MNLLGIDPGRDKTGLAVIAFDGHILWRKIIEPTQISEELPPLLPQWMITRIALGNSTSSAKAQGQIEKIIQERRLESVQLVLVDEKNSTLEARKLYFDKFPPNGLRRFLPLSTQVPPVPIDDFAAAIIARRLLKME